MKFVCQDMNAFGIDDVNICVEGPDGGLIPVFRSTRVAHADDDVNRVALGFLITTLLNENEAR